MQEKIMRKYSSSGTVKRDQLVKFRCSEEEKSIIHQFVNNKGFETVRDYLLFLAQNDDAISAEVKRLSNNWRIHLAGLSTYINKIDAGIEVEESKNKLVEGVRFLCQEYR